MLSRRTLVSCSSMLAAVSLLPRVAFATVRSQPRQRFVLVIMRGAMDGLAAVPPVGDPDYAATHGPLAIAAPGQPDGALPLDGRFALHPALAAIHPLFAAKELLIVHAMATPYRQRSHFDAQNLLENGTNRPGGANDGWTNRMLTALGAERWEALAVGPDVPLVLKGSAQVGNWRPQGGEPEASANLLLSVARMYEGDPALASALREGLATGDMIDEAMQRLPGGSDRRGGKGGFRDLAVTTGSILAAEDGPNIAVLEIGGWDTHVGQGGAAKGRLTGALGTFGDGLAGLRQSLGGRWAETVVVAVTEFGRTARPNGTGGTDHGTATAGFALGGKLAGGRVLADWPGLATGALYQQRDLAPTTDMRSLLKGVVGPHLGVPARMLEETIFPDSAGARPIQDLVRS